MMNVTNLLLLGAISMASITIGVFFLRFWKMTRDRFFLFFAASFLIEGVNRASLGFARELTEDCAIHYVVRLLSYGLILIAIIDKNIPRNGKK